MSGDRLAPPKFSPRQWEHIAEHYDARCQCALCKRLERYDRRKALARLDSEATEGDA